MVVNCLALTLTLLAADLESSIVDLKLSTDCWIYGLKVGSFYLGFDAETSNNIEAKLKPFSPEVSSY